jgi:starvation-inducible outer membrane lipoprotein
MGYKSNLNFTWENNMNHRRHFGYAVILIFSYLLVGCIPQPTAIQTEEVEATVVARVEATLVANSV